MWMWRVSAIAVLVALCVAPIPFAQAAPIACADNVTVARAVEAFEAYCARCHTAKAISGSYFAGADTGEARRRERELAAFLDRHSSCPHRHHEEIAAWLRQLSETE